MTILPFQTKPKFLILQVNVYGMEENDQVLCVTWKEHFTSTYTIVRADFTGQKPTLKCSTCKDSNCKHCKAVYSESMNPDRLLLETLTRETKWRSRYVPVPISKIKIPFSGDTRSRKLSLTELKPSADGSCHECGSPWNSDVGDGECVKVYTKCEILNATGKQLREIWYFLLFYCEMLYMEM